jgi:hypothetical protein
MTVKAPGQSLIRGTLTGDCRVLFLRDGQRRSCAARSLGPSPAAPWTQSVAAPAGQPLKALVKDELRGPVTELVRRVVVEPREQPRRVARRGTPSTFGPLIGHSLPGRRSVSPTENPA